MRWIIVAAVAAWGGALGGCAMAPLGAAHLAVDADQPAHLRAPKSALPSATRPPSTDTPTNVAVPDWSIRAAEMAVDRVIIYTADYAVAVANPSAAVGDVQKLAEELKGYVQSVSGERITIRVPAGTFKTATDRIERLGQLVSRKVEAQDVSEEYVDLKMRLAGSQAMLKRLEALLEKSPDAKAALDIEREIARVMTEIERLQGRIRLLETQIAMSTITVAFQRLAEAPRPALLRRQLPFDWLRTLGINRLLDY